MEKQAKMIESGCGKAHDLKIGEPVLIRQRRTNKLVTPFKVEPLAVTRVKGSMVTAHGSQFKRIAEDDSEEEGMLEGAQQGAEAADRPEGDVGIREEVNNDHHQGRPILDIEDGARHQAGVRRTTRERRTPAWMEDYTH